MGPISECQECGTECKGFAVSPICPDCERKIAEEEEEEEG
jgi:Fe-S-cluster containining protein